MSKNPIQPLELQDNVIRFKPNQIVRTLLDTGKLDMNALARMNFSQDDREQFAQLIGYSLSGFNELNYVSDETYNAAYNMYHNKANAQEVRENVLRVTLDTFKESVREPIAQLFGIHPDDLKGR